MSHCSEREQFQQELEAFACPKFHENKDIEHFEGGSIHKKFSSWNMTCVGQLKQIKWHMRSDART